MFNNFSQDAFNVTKLSDSLSSTIASTASEMNNAMIESDTSNVTSSGFFSYNVTPLEYESIPNVDRSLKAKALLRMSELTKKKMSDVLEAEKDLIEDTLQLERKQLEMENRWEVFRYWVTSLFKNLKQSEKGVQIIIAAL